MRLLGISGSLRPTSANTKLVEAAASSVGDDVQFVIFRGVAAMPHFIAGDEGCNEAVDELRSQLGEADGVLIATPEYAHALPGSLKNALDWIVGSGELDGKPISIVSAAPAANRGGNAREMLERTLRAQGAVVVESRTIVVAINQPNELQTCALQDLHAVLDYLTRQVETNSERGA